MKIITLRIPERTGRQLEDARIAANVCGTVNGKAGVDVLGDGPALRGTRADIEKILPFLKLNGGVPAYYP